MEEGFSLVYSILGAQLSVSFCPLYSTWDPNHGDGAAYIQNGSSALKMSPKVPSPTQRYVL